PLFDAVQKMHATTTLNPYEREILYGYPYVIGRHEGDSIRGPLLTMPVRVESAGDGFTVHPADDVVRFNSLPFPVDADTAAHSLAVARVLEATPGFPLGARGLADFLQAIMREFRVEKRDALLNGRLVAPPQEPRTEDGLWLVDQAAIFVAPKTSYFLWSDLGAIAQADPSQTQDGALVPLLCGAGAE